MRKKISSALQKSTHKLRRKSKSQTQIGLMSSGEEMQVPKITNETIVVHREAVLKGARKYIYPLQHSKHKIVMISTAVFITAVVSFSGYCVLSLYRLQTTSTFMYKVTQVVPFPVARSGARFVAYENYLFELRHYIHYYETQQKLSFESDAGRAQLQEFKKRALERVINDAYIKRLADQNSVSVSDKEVDYQIDLLKSQNRLGSNDKVFEDVLKDYWGWSVADFRRSLRQQILSQKVAAALDKDTKPRAEAVLTEIKNGKDFAAAAKESSDDAATRDNGGEFGFLIEKNNRDIPAQSVEALFKLQTGQYSDIINIGYALQIVKNIETQGDKVRGAHIIFNFADINKAINDAKEKQKTRAYITISSDAAAAQAAPPATP